MKLKFLSLFLALGIFALGTSVMAQGTPDAPANPADQASQADLGNPAVDPASVICPLLPSSCKPCSTMADVTSCFGSLKGSTLTNTCDKACNRVTCKINVIQTLCMSKCCPANSGKINSCLSQNGGKICPSSD